VEDEIKAYSEEELGKVIAKALAEADERKVAEAKKAEEEAVRIEERAAELAEEKVKELEAFNRQKGAPLTMETAEPGFGEGEHKAAFRRWLATGDQGAAKSLVPAGGAFENMSSEFVKTLSQEQKTLLGQSGTGTYLVPDDFVNQIVALRDNASFVRQMGVRVIQTNLPVIDIPAESTSVANFSRTAEAGAYATDLPAFAQNQVSVQKWTLRHTMSEEFLDDEAANFDDWFARAISRSMAQTEAYYVAIGSGTNQHEGIFEGGDTDALTFDSSANITPDEVFELMMILKTEYQPQAAWLMDNDTWRYLATLRDSNNWAWGAADMLTISVDGSARAGTLYGRPVFLQGDIPVRATGVGVIAVGDPFYYALVERKGLSITRNPYLQMANGLVDFFSHFRQSGAVLAEEAWAIGVMN